MDVRLVVYALATRFFLFEMALFSTVRRVLREWIPGMNKLMDCAFCSGFWVGLAVFALARKPSYRLVLNALVVGYLAFFLRLSLKSMATVTGEVPDGNPS